MFTGLVEDIGKIVQVLPGPTTDLWIRTGLGASSFALGESVAVQGACLTVVETGSETFRVQAAPETLRRTTLGSLSAGSEVHLERALRLGDRLGGHLILGHVDAVAEVRAVRSEGGAVVLEVGLPPELAGFFIAKGSVTLDGVSLTVNTLDADRFSVALIPETQVRTLLGRCAPGDRVNLEADVIGKYVARLVGLRQGGVSTITEETLRAAGFIK